MTETQTLILAYLAGHVPKGDSEIPIHDNWRSRYQEALGEIPGLECIDPYDPHLDESDSTRVFGMDCSLIAKSNLIIVNAEKQLGAGTSQEMVVAKYLGKHVITVLPKDSYHRRSNLHFGGKLVADWKHPFVASFSDAIVERVEDIPSVMDPTIGMTPKDLSIIDQAIKYYDSFQ